MEELFDYLTETFGNNTPFGLNDISFKSYSKPWICKALQGLCTQEKVCRFSKGWYYIPSETVLGKSTLNPYTIVKIKYLGDESDVQGFYCGLTLQNKLGLSTQMPNIPEIMTNNEETRGRTVSIGNQQINIRKARTTITKENVDVLTLLEALSYMDSEYYNEARSKTLRNYTIERNISRLEISRYLKFFPDRTARNLLETGVAYAAS